MRVGISTGHPTSGPAGPRRYAQTLCDVLRAHARRDELVELRAPSNSAAARRAWDLVGVGVAARRAAVDVLHCAGIYPPLLRVRPLVLTVHDLAVRHTPQSFPRLNRSLGWQLWARLARRAERFVAVSEATKRDLVAALGVPPADVSVVPHGVGPAFRPRSGAEVSLVRQQYGLAGDYFLSVGTVEPRKNLGRTIQAFRLLRRRRATDHLVVVGGRGWGSERLQRRLESGGFGPAVRYLGRVPDGDLPALYTGAVGLVYPSLFEGFGLPVLEAMACGCPVITSNRGGLDELARGAALQVDPLEVEEICAAMGRLAADEATRAALRCRGRERAARFTWERAAQQTLAVYRQALEASPSAPRTFEQERSGGAR